DVDLVDPPLAQPVRELHAGLVGALAAAVGSRVGTLVEDGVDGAGGHRGGEVRVAADSLGPGDAVRGPGVDVVRVVGEVSSGGDVVVPGGHHVPVAGRCLPDQLGDRGSHFRPTGHGEAAPFTEVVLHIDDDQGAAHGR